MAVAGQALLCPATRQDTEQSQRRDGDGSPQRHDHHRSYPHQRLSQQGRHSHQQNGAAAWPGTDGQHGQPDSPFLPGVGKILWRQVMMSTTAGMIMMLMSMILMGMVLMEMVVVHMTCRYFSCTPP